MERSTQDRPQDPTDRRVATAWDERLVERYVSTGQAGDVAVVPDPARVPFLRRLVETSLPASRELAVADLACGHGDLVAVLRSLGYADVEGVDASGEQVAAAHRAGVDGVACADLRTWLADRVGEFDALFLVDALEHFDPGAALEVLDLAHRALVPGGRLVLHVPNAAGLFGARVQHGDLTHRTSFTDRSLVQACRAAGFARVTCSEDPPAVHGAASLARRVLWTLLSLPARLALAAETGRGGHLLTQNLTAVANRSEEEER